MDAKVMEQHVDAKWQIKQIILQAWRQKQQEITGLYGFSTRLIIQNIKESDV